MTRTSLRAVLLSSPRHIASTALAAVAMTLGGCASGADSETYAMNSALRPLRTPADATPADSDRAALARLIGVWTFEGWSVDANGARQTAAGTAAATIEHEHFVLLDIRSTVGQLSGQAGSTSGSMLLACEPGEGFTLTAWGDASPAVRRLSGAVHGIGSAFVLRESGRGTSLSLMFESDDRWVAEVHAVSGDKESAIAHYTFTRRATSN